VRKEGRKGRERKEERNEGRYLTDLILVGNQLDAKFLL